MLNINQWSSVTWSPCCTFSEYKRLSKVSHSGSTCHPQRSSSFITPATLPVKRAIREFICRPLSSKATSSVGSFPNYKRPPWSATISQKYHQRVHWQSRSTTQLIRRYSHFLPGCIPRQEQLLQGNSKRLFSLRLPTSNVPPVRLKDFFRRTVSMYF